MHVAIYLYRDTDKTEWMDSIGYFFAVLRSFKWISSLLTYLRTEKEKEKKETEENKIIKFKWKFSFL